MSANALLQTSSETFSNNGQAKQGFNSPRLQVTVIELLVELEPAN